MSLPQLGASRPGGLRTPQLHVSGREGVENDPCGLAAPDGCGDRGGDRAAVATRRVLVAVNDPVIAELVPASLRFCGFETQVARTSAEVLAARSRLRPHVLVLDTQLRGPDGFPLAQRLRRRDDGTPVLFLTTRESRRPPALTLTVGGDDYLPKPFSLDELAARVRALLRRAEGTGMTAVLRFADLEFNEDTQLVLRAGVPVSLKPRERQILRHLLVNNGRIVTRAHIHEHVWPYDHRDVTRTVDVHICTLRRKLDRHGPPLIKTLHGIGYTLQTPDAVHSI